MAGEQKIGSDFHRWEVWENTIRMEQSFFYSYYLYRYILLYLNFTHTIFFWLFDLSWDHNFHNPNITVNYKLQNLFHGCNHMCFARVTYRFCIQSSILIMLVNNTALIFNPYLGEEIHIFSKGICVNVMTLIETWLVNFFFRTVNHHPNCRAIYNILFVICTVIIKQRMEITTIVQNFKINKSECNNQNKKWRNM